MRARRVKAVILQNWFVMRHSPFRIMELLYWPLIELLLWGFITTYLVQRHLDVPGGARVLLGAVVLWQVMFRSQTELSMVFLIDMWDRNVVNLYASPLRQSEYVLGGLIFSAGRVVVGTGVLMVVARVFFSFDLLRAGSVLGPSLVLLSAMGWALGLMVRAALLRFGTNAEVLAWSVAFLIQPVAAVFYPVSSLPDWLQTIAHLVPASYVFEALRAYLDHRAVLVAQLGVAAAIDVAYLVLGTWLSALAFQAVRRRGLLAKPGY
jgi:ABC-2 type transport system permease protein